MMKSHNFLIVMYILWFLKFLMFLLWKAYQTVHSWQNCPTGQPAKPGKYNQQEKQTILTKRPPVATTVPSGMNTVLWSIGIAVIFHEKLKWWNHIVFFQFVCIVSINQNQSNVICFGISGRHIFSPHFHKTACFRTKSICWFLKFVVFFCRKLTTPCSHARTA